MSTRKTTSRWPIRDATENCRDSKRSAEIQHLDIELREAMGDPLIRQCWRYVVNMEVVPQFYWRWRSGLFRRDLNVNEVPCLRLIKQEREPLPVTVTEFASAWRTSRKGAISGRRGS